MTYASQADLEKFLQVTFGNDPDPVVTYLLESASALVETYVGYPLTVTSYSETYSPPAGSMLRLRHGPITEDTNDVTVTDDGTALVNGTDFYVGRDYLIRVTAAGRERTWVSGTFVKVASLVVGYDAGYDFTADPLTGRPAVARDVTCRIASRAFRAAATWANLPTGADALKALQLAGSDSVEYRDDIADVAVNSMELTRGDKHALNAFRTRVLA